MDLFDGFYNGKRVLVTGHTGFKGSWLSVWLHALGAQVCGVSLDPATPRDNYLLSGIGRRISSDLRADIRDGGRLWEIFAAFRPEIVFHLAAQPLVLTGYARPSETYETNVMGTVHVMEAVRAADSVRSAVMITTDKCYENHDTGLPFREEDPFGGYDPYSSSKGACEIAIQSWRRSFGIPLASARAGNVIGGGDWAENRIVPDCIRAWEAGLPVDIRSPRAVRPWQHVLEPLRGYLMLARRLWDSPGEFAGGWNFGPDPSVEATVWEMASELTGQLGGGVLRDVSDPSAPHEAALLSLDISKARSLLGWQPCLDLHETVSLTADWYRRYRTEDAGTLCLEEIERYTAWAGK